MGFACVAQALFQCDDLINQGLDGSVGYRVDRPVRDRPDIGQQLHYPGISPCTALLKTKAFASFRKRHHSFQFTFFDAGVVARTIENGGFGPSDNSSHEAGTFNSALFCEKQVQIGL
jgi:hypothetical protein